MVLYHQCIQINGNEVLFSQRSVLGLIHVLQRKQNKALSSLHAVTLLAKLGLVIDQCGCGWRNVNRLLSGVEGERSSVSTPPASGAGSLPSGGLDQTEEGNRLLQDV